MILQFDEALRPKPSSSDHTIIHLKFRYSLLEGLDGLYKSRYLGERIPLMFSTDCIIV